MELYAALLAVTILCLTSTMGVSEECNKSISPKQGLDKAKFFSGTWYVTHYQYKGIKFADTFCSSFTSRESGGAVNDVIFHHNTNSQRSIYSTGEGKLESSGVQYTAKFKTVNKQKAVIKTHSRNTYTITVLEADDSSALVHICLRYGSEEVGDLYMILSHQKTGEPSATVRQALTQAGLLLPHFIATEDLGCPYDDEFTSK
uniref:Nitrophorin domain-containing protein n=1 Tax=Rhodnius prolixus TaxID=13249 RepID=T1H7T1_RHOPR